MIETVSEISRLWDRVLAKVEPRLNDRRIYDSFFAPTYIDSLEGNTIIVIANSPLAKMILSEKYLELVKEAILETTGTNFEIRFVEKAAAKKASEEKESKPVFFADSHLDKKFTFDSFIVGDSNREAHQASLMVAKNPGRFFNPLILYSDSGLGKTHLMQAIGNAVKEENPAVKVLYISASDFVNEYIHFVQGAKEDQSLIEFFRKDVDVFLIDDIQYLIGKKKTCEMFFDVFTTLAKAEKQIVVTSDQSPSLLDGLDDRLKTRLQAGLLISIQRPDVETAENILRSKIKAGGLDPKDFDDDVISFIASRFSNNVREIEMSLNRLLFYTINMKPTKHITMQVATEAIQGLISVQDDQAKLTEEKIINTVADYYSLTSAQIKGKIRTSQIAMARHIAMYLDKTLLDTPFTKIGQTFGGKDHATVMKAVEKVEKTLKLDAALQKAVSDLKAKLKK